MLVISEDDPQQVQQPVHRSQRQEVPVNILLKDDQHARYFAISGMSVVLEVDIDSNRVVHLTAEVDGKVRNPVDGIDNLSMGRFKKLHAPHIVNPEKENESEAPE